MSGEPELSEGTSSEWVQYLQRLLTSHGYWQGGDDGAFTPELTAVVIQVQQSAGVSPADGVVRQSTWDALHGLGQSAQATQPASEHGSGVPAPEGPGVPAFEYTTPSVPVAEVAMVLPGGNVYAVLNLRGKVKVTFQQSVQGYTLNVNDQTWKVAASSALDGLNTGIEVSGLGGETPAISSSWGNQYVKTSTRVTPPNTISYLGNVNINYQYETNMGPVQVQGQPGFQLDVTVTPNEAPETAPVDVPTYEYNYGWLAVAGMALVAAIAIAAAPETGGASLALLAI